MKADAIRAAVTELAAERDPTDEIVAAAAVEAVEIVLGFFADVRRIADAASNLGECVDDNCQPAFVVSAIVAIQPPADAD